MWGAQSKGVSEEWWIGENKSRWGSGEETDLGTPKTIPIGVHATWKNLLARPGREMDRRLKLVSLRMLKDNDGHKYVM